MTVTGWIQILLYCVIIVALTLLLGGYMTRVFSGERTLLSPILRPVELAIYKLAGVNERSEQHAVTYTIGMLLFHAGGLLILYVLMRAQAILPFNPAGHVCDEADGGVERQIRRDRRLSGRIERQDRLGAHQHIENEQAARVKQ